jgi:hypothetical protein
MGECLFPADLDLCVVIIIIIIINSEICMEQSKRLFHNILSTAPQLSISQKVPGTLPEDGNVMPKHVGATIHN